VNLAGYAERAAKPYSKVSKEISKQKLAKEAKAVVICPTLVFGQGHGLHKESVQIPRLVDQSRKRGAGVYIGQGVNVWSNVCSSMMSSISSCWY
jgi:hypothetical protein